MAQGPIIDQQGFDKINRHIEDAKNKGGQVLTGGAPHEKGGTFFQPTVLTGATSEMDLYGEETFGPVAALFKFETEDEASPPPMILSFGLAAYFFTKDTPACSAYQKRWNMAW